MKTFIFTCGDINGVGPEIVVKTLNKIAKSSRKKILFICPENIFKQEVRRIRPSFKYEITNSSEIDPSIPVSVVNFNSAEQVIGKPTRNSGLLSYDSIKIAYNISTKISEAAIITAPISKTAWSMANINYPGHTELFAELYKAKNYAMFFLSKKMNAALLTIHTPLKEVSTQITSELLKNKFQLILETLNQDFMINTPRIAVLGLNPHAGENGLIGKEEKNIVIPFLKGFTKNKYFYGPFPSDGFFGTKQFLNYDVVVGMYHDQILNPFKLLNFNTGVNFTAGLSIVRTSPDHGTAFEIAGKGIADESSMLQAFKYAERILNNRLSNAKNIGK
ncbi:MAG: 4-hydroxythreonine-4-phosphate dehydrogenase PdxA [Ignavibacteriaceae bacterium]|nr:4-hydroxythreonine-4-phosphate dehydrogenase PdxA [Ignavibacteriaceae bacterium]